MPPPTPCPARTPAPPPPPPHAQLAQVSHHRPIILGSRGADGVVLGSTQERFGKTIRQKKRLEGWTRTTDRPDYSRALYQLSYCQFPGPPARLRRHPDGAAGAMSALSPRGVLEGFESFLRACFAKAKTKSDTFSIFACHPCAGAMLIFSVSFQFLRMTPKSSETGVVGSPNRRGGGSMGALWLDPPSLPSPRAPGPSSLPV